MGAGNDILRARQMTIYADLGDGDDHFRGELNTYVGNTKYATDSAIDDAINDGIERFIRGGSGNDSLIVGFGDNVVYGDDGEDKIIWYANERTESGGDGKWLDEDEDGENDHHYTIVYGGEGDDSIENTWPSTANAITLTSIDSNGEIYGEGGNDTIIASDLSDKLYGGDDDDNIEAKAGDDIVNGDSGNDVLNAGIGSDTVDGGDGGDFINAGPAGHGYQNYVSGGTGADMFLISAYTESLIPGGTSTTGVSGTDWNNWFLQTSFSRGSILASSIAQAGLGSFGPFGSFVYGMGSSALSTYIFGSNGVAKSATLPDTYEEDIVSYTEINDFNPEDILVVSHGAGNPLHSFDNQGAYFEIETGVSPAAVSSPSGVLALVRFDSDFMTYLDSRLSYSYNSFSDNTVIESYLDMLKDTRVSVIKNTQGTYEDEDGNDITAVLADDEFINSIDDDTENDYSSLLNDSVLENEQSMYIYGSTGPTVYAGVNNASTSAKFLFGGSFNDVITGYTFSNIASELPDGGEVSAYIMGLDGEDTLIGSNYADELFGGQGRDIIVGLNDVAGIDVMSGGSAYDLTAEDEESAVDSYYEGAGGWVDRFFVGHGYDAILDFDFVAVDTKNNRDVIIVYNDEAYDGSAGEEYSAFTCSTIANGDTLPDGEVYATSNPESDAIIQWYLDDNGVPGELDNDNFVVLKGDRNATVCDDDEFEYTTISDLNGDEYLAIASESDVFTYFDTDNDGNYDDMLTADY